jgi:phosphatidate phosphatase PAH1
MQGRIGDSRRNRRVSRLVLGTKIDDPLEFFGTPANSSPFLRSASQTIEEETAGYAFDSIVVEASDGKLHHAGDDGYSYSFSVAFGRGNGFNIGDGDDKNDNESENDDGDGDGDKNPVTTTRMAMQLFDRGDESGETWFRVHEHDPENKEQNNHCWEELQPLLKDGANSVAFCCLHNDDKNGSGHESMQFANAAIWLWKECDEVVISDIDGTITKSNARGVMGTILTNQYAAASHSGICQLLSQMIAIATPTPEKSSPPPPSSKKRIVYLTSRPIHLANKTRKFLSGLTQQQQQQQQQQQNDGDDNGNVACELPPSPTIVGLPEGPLLGFGGNLVRVLAMEVLSKSTQAFKAGELEKHIAGPFRRCCARSRNDNDNSNSNHKDSVFVAAFGNNLNDVQAYHKIGVDLDKIFMIDKHSRIVTFGKWNNASANTTTNASTNALTNAPPSRERHGDDESSFPSHSWYKDCIETVFENGYSDKNLRSLLGV